MNNNIITWCIVLILYLMSLFIRRYISKMKYQYLFSIGFKRRIRYVGYKDKREVTFVRNDIVLTRRQIDKLSLIELKGLLE